MIADVTAYVVPLVLLSLMLAFAHGALSRAGGPRSRVFVVLRVLFPSWRFFDQPSAPSILWARSAPPDGRWSAFERTLSSPPDGFGRLFINAQGNLLLAYQGLCDQLVSDLSELEPDASEAARALVSYELVTELVRSSLRAHAPGTRFQFKLETEAQTGAPASVLVTSEVHVL